MANWKADVSRTGTQWKGWNEIGVQNRTEHAGGDAYGVFWVPSAQDPATQTRSYAKTGHHDVAVSRPNYHLLVGHKVLDILFTDDLRADGVTFISRENQGNGTVYTVKAKTEVILAAGSFHSPQILQRSGVGPKKLLEEAKVEVKLDLPGVGMNLQDHSSARLAYNCRNKYELEKPVEADNEQSQMISGRILKHHGLIQASLPTRKHSMTETEQVRQPSLMLPNDSNQ